MEASIGVPECISDVAVFQDSVGGIRLGGGEGSAKDGVDKLLMSWRRLSLRVEMTAEE